MNTSSTRTYSRIALFAALIAAGSYISIPLPGSPVPVVLANLFAVLAGMVLGPVNGAVSAVIYLLIGTAGLPVFSAGSGGPAHLVGPTGGYLVGYIAAALVTGLVVRALHSERCGKYRATAYGTLAAVAGMAAVYLPGVFWMAFLLELSLPAALATGVVPFIPGDILKAVVAGATLPALTQSGLIFRQREAVPAEATPTRHTEGVTESTGKPGNTS